MVKFSKSMAELSPFSIFLIISQWKLVIKYLETSRFSVFLIISQWKLVNKISHEPLKLGS